MALKGLISQLAFNGYGSTQLDMLAEYAGKPIAETPHVVEPEVLAARQEVNDLRDRGQLAFLDSTIEVQTPEAWHGLATLTGQERTDYVLGLLPDHLIAQYEDCVATIDRITAERGYRERNALEDYRGIGQLADVRPDKDTTWAPFRDAVVRRYGMSVDEIATKFEVSESQLVETCRRLLADARDGRAEDHNLASLRRFARHIESGQVLGYYESKPKPAPQPIAGGGPAIITSIAAAKRTGKAIKAKAKARKAKKSAPRATTKGKAPKQPTMSSEDATRFDRYSVANASLVRSSLKCGCMPYEDVFTYNRWLAQGLQVQKGESSIKVPVIGHKNVEDKDTGEIKVISIKCTSPLFCRCQVAPIKDRTAV